MSPGGSVGELEEFRSLPGSSDPAARLDEGVDEFPDEVRDRRPEYIVLNFSMVKGFIICPIRACLKRPDRETADFSRAAIARNRRRKHPQECQTTDDVQTPLDRIVHRPRAAAANAALGRGADPPATVRPLPHLSAQDRRGVQSTPRPTLSASNRSASLDGIGRRTLRTH